MTTSSLTVYCESPAVRRRTYWPIVVRVTVVCAACAFARLTEPGPLTTLQEIAGGLHAGKPSSLTAPFKVNVVAGKAIFRSVPALTIGGELPTVKPYCK